MQANKFSERPSGPFKTRLSVTRNTPLLGVCGLKKRENKDIDNWKNVNDVMSSWEVSYSHWFSEWLDTATGHSTSTFSRVVGNWVKFHILMYLGLKQKYPINEGFLTSLGTKSNKKQCRQNHGLAMGIFYRHRKPIVLPPRFNLQIQTSTWGTTFLFDTFIKKTWVYHLLKFYPISRPP